MQAQAQTHEHEHTVYAQKEVPGDTTTVIPVGSSRIVSSDGSSNGNSFTFEPRAIGAYDSDSDDSVTGPISFPCSSSSIKVAKPDLSIVTAGASGTLTFFQALFRAAVCTRRISEVIAALGVVSKPLQIAMRAESAFVEVFRARYPDIAVREQRDELVKLLNDACIPAMVTKFSILRQGVELSCKRSTIIVVEPDETGGGYGIIVEPCPPSDQQQPLSFGIEKDLAEALSREWSTLIMERGVVMLRDQLDSVVSESETLGYKLKEVRMDREDLLLKIGKVELSNRIAESSLEKLKVLATRLKADLEIRQAENVSLVHDAKADRDSARKAEEELRAEVGRILHRSVELKKQADVYNKRLEQTMRSKEAAQRSLEAAVSAVKERTKKAGERKSAAVKVAEAAEGSADEAEKLAAVARMSAKTKRLDQRAAECALLDVITARDAERAKLSEALEELHVTREKLESVRRTHETVQADVGVVQGRLNASSALLAGLRGALSGASSQIRTQTQEALDGVEAAFWEGMRRLEDIRGSISFVGK